MRYRIKAKRVPFEKDADKFGWGDDQAQTAFLTELHPGAQKFNPNHEPAGSPIGGEFASGDSSILFEVAPDPNNKALTDRWEKLTPTQKVEVSNAVVKDITPEALKVLETDGQLNNLIGGWDGHTNPCYALHVDDAHLTDAAKLYGYALSQEAVAVSSDHPIDGLSPTGVAVIQLPASDMNLEALSAHYANLEKVDGVGGFTAYPDQNEMHILNFSDHSTEDLAAAIDRQLGGEYNVYTDQVYSTLIEKDQYSAGNQEAQGPGSSVWRESADHLRQSASEAINQELGRRGKTRQRWRLSRK